MPRAMRVEYRGAIYHVMDAEQKANRIISEELLSRDWKESDLTTRSRSDRGKLAIAARLRGETSLPIRWVAARVHIGTAKGAKTVLHQVAHGHHQRKPPSATERCAQLQFQSTVYPFIAIRLQLACNWL